MPNNVADILDQTVASLIDLRYQAKNAHWNYRGPTFYQYHLLFDRIYDELEEIIDQLAEKCVGMGKKVSGNITQAGLRTILSNQTSELTDLPGDLLLKIEVLTQINLKNMKTCDELGDSVVSGLLEDAQRVLDTHHYLLSAS